MTEKNLTTLDEKIKHLINLRGKKRQALATTLQEIDAQVQELFERKNIAGQCGNCTGCLNTANDERGVTIGKLSFSDGGTCYRAHVRLTVDGEYGTHKKWIYNLDSKSFGENVTLEDIEAAIVAVSEIESKIDELIAEQ